jgi:hypothetical protein
MGSYILWQETDSIVGRVELPTGGLGYSWVERRFLVREDSTVNEYISSHKGAYEMRGNQLVYWQWPIQVPDDTISTVILELPAESGDSWSGCYSSRYKCFCECFLVVDQAPVEVAAGSFASAYRIERKRCNYYRWDHVYTYAPGIGFLWRRGRELAAFHVEP